MVLAHTYAMQRALAMQFEARHTRKVYEAVLDTRVIEAAAAAAAAARATAAAGAHAQLPPASREFAASALMSADEGEITTPLGRHSHVPLLQVALPPGPGVRPAATRWRVLERGRGAVRVELQPLTGRTHQLRLHTALPPPYGLGAPICGDGFYGDPALAAASYLHELAEDAARHYHADAAAARVAGGAAAAGDGSGTAAANAPYVVMGRPVTAAERHSVVQLLLQQQAARSALLGAHGLAHARQLPFLPSCAFLDGASPTAITSTSPAVPRLLLHARELHLVDHFPHATPAGAGTALRVGAPPPHGWTQASRPGDGATSAPVAAPVQPQLGPQGAGRGDLLRLSEWAVVDVSERALHQLPGTVAAAVGPAPPVPGPASSAAVQAYEGSVARKGKPRSSSHADGGSNVGPAAVVPRRMLKFGATCPF
jgi:hypothetical protein